MAHHYVPRFYFKNFTFNSDQSLVFSMNQQGEIHENAIGDISAQKNYNTPKQECEQSQLETRHSVILRKIIETFDSGNSNHSRGFVEFVSFLIGNNIYVRKQMAEILSQMELKIKGFGGDRNITIHNEYRRRLDLSLAFSDCVFEEFESWNFACLGKPNGVNVFITSDNPVSIINPDDLSVSARVNIEYGEIKIKNIGIDEIPISEDRVSREMQFSIILDHVSLGQDVVIIFPIIPSLCLIGFSDSERHARFINGPKNDIRTIGLLNLITFNQCNKAVYSHSKEHLENSKTNLQNFLKFCKERNYAPSFDIGIR